MSSNVSKILAMAIAPSDTTTSSSSFSSPEELSGSFAPSFSSRCEVKDCLVVTEDWDDSFPSRTQKSLCNLHIDNTNLLTPPFNS